MIQDARVIVFVFVVAGCGGGEATPVDASMPQPDAAPSSDAAPPDAAAGGFLFEIRLTRTGGTERVPGVRACEVGASPENCDVSNDLGEVSLVLPADSEVRIRYEADGFRSFDHVFRTSSTDPARPRWNIYT